MANDASKAMWLKTVGRIAAFLVICLLSVAALFLLLPGAKEGFSFEDWPILAGVTAGLILAGVAWWFIAGRTLWPAAFGWAVLAVPIGANGIIAWSLFDAYLDGRRIAADSRIESFRETPIEWPGFDGPVGWKIDLTLRHPSGLEGIVLPPELRFGPSVAIPRDRLIAVLTDSASYFAGSQGKPRKHPLTLLKTVLFQRLYPERYPARPFAADGTTVLRYHLFPGTVALLVSPSHVCLASHTAGIPKCAPGAKPESGCAPRNRRLVETPTYQSGNDLTANWGAAGAYDMVVDLSRPLTDILRKNSRLQREPALWTAIQKRLEPSGLARAGYTMCPPGRDSHSAFRTCYCRAPSGG